MNAGVTGSVEHSRRVIASLLMGFFRTDRAITNPSRATPNAFACAMPVPVKFEGTT